MTSPSPRPSENFDEIVKAMMRDSSPVDRGCCPTPEELWDACHFESSPEEQRRIVLHTASCAACAREWSLSLNQTSRELVDEVGLPEQPGAEEGPFPGRSRRVFGFVLAAVAAVGIIVLFPERDRLEVNSKSDFRGRRDLSPVRPAQAYKFEQGSFFWPQTQGSKSYKLLIYNRELDLIKRLGPILSAPYYLEESVRQDLLERGAFFWRVEWESKQGVRKLSAPIELDENYSFEKAL